MLKSPRRSAENRLGGEGNRIRTLGPSSEYTVTLSRFGTFRFLPVEKVAPRGRLSGADRDDVMALDRTRLPHRCGEDGIGGFADDPLLLCLGIKFAMDSLLEGDGFELPVPVRQAKLTRFCR